MNGRLFMEAMGDIKDEFIMEAADIDEIRKSFSEWDDEEEENEPTPQKPTKNKKRISKPLRILIAAVIVLSLLFATCFASAEFFDFNIAEELVEYFSNHLKIKQEGGTQNADSYSLAGSALAKELEANGISPVTLPAALLTDEWEIDDIVYQPGDIVSSALVTFGKEDIEISAHILKYSSNECIPDIDIMYPKKGSQHEINGLNVFIVNSQNAVVVYYIDSLTTYTFTFNCDYDSVVEIIKTIK